MKIKLQNRFPWKTQYRNNFEILKNTACDNIEGKSKFVRALYPEIMVLYKKFSLYNVYKNLALKH